MVILGRVLNAEAGFSVFVFKNAISGTALWLLRLLDCLLASLFLISFLS